MLKSKLFLALVLIATIVVSFAILPGCKTTTPTTTTEVETTPTVEEPEEEEEEVTPVTIKFANYSILETGYTEFWEGVKSGFETKYPKYKIEWVTAPYGEIMTTVINMAGAGDKVDLILGEIDWTPGLADAGLTVPIDTILNKEFLDDFYPEILNATNIDGKPYAVPMLVSPYIVYYNKDLFTQAGFDPSEPPETYDEMLTYAEELSKLKDKDGNKVYAFGQTTASVPVSGASLTSMIFNFGGTLLDDNGALSVDNQGFKDAITMLKTLDEKGYNPQNAKLKDLRNLFALGQLAMYYDQTWGFNGVKSINPEAVNFAASARPLSGGSGTGQSILQASCLMLMDNGPANKKAVSALIEYIISPEVLKDYIINITPAFPPIESMADISGIGADSELLKGAAGSEQNIKSQVFIPQITDIYLELASLAQGATVGKRPIDTAIADFKSTCEAILKK